MKPEEEILISKTNNFDVTQKILKKYGFIVQSSNYELGFPAVEIRTTPESLIQMAKRLQDTLSNRFVNVKSNSESPWTPQIHAVFDPAGNTGIIYLYGVDDDLMKDF
jgi:hypothetical protein